MASTSAPDFSSLSGILKDYAPNISDGLVVTLSSIASSCERIAKHLRVASGDAKAGTSNKYGDEQLDIDIYADRLIFENLKKCGFVDIAASEENPQEIQLGGEGYSVAFDPLDGSSIIDANFAVGSIFGVWPSNKDTNEVGLLGRAGKEQVASCMAIYGPRTHLAIALSTAVTETVPAAFDLVLGSDDNQWEVAKKSLKIGKVFAPGNLRATSDNRPYKSLFDYWVCERYTLRYTGGMVPDVYYILVKGKGVFTNVSSPLAPAKLRLLYECAPIALLVEAAGGVSISTSPLLRSMNQLLTFAKMSVVAPQLPCAVEVVPHPISVLDLRIDNMDTRIGVCYGGIGEVEKFKQFMFTT